MTNHSRRKFVKSSLLFGAASFIGCSKPAQPLTDERVFPVETSSTPANQLAGKVPTAVLGKTGVTVPILAHGGMYDLNNIMVARAFDLGINYFDTADCYMNGQSEVILGRVLERQGRRKDAFIVSKDHPKQPSDLLRSIDKRLENLRTDYLDLYYMHQLCDGEYPAEAIGWPKSKEIKDVAESLKKQGKIKFFGFSCHNGLLPELLDAAAEGGFIDVIMFKYNFRDVSADALNRAIDKAKAARIGLVAMKTQGGRVSFAERADTFKQKGFNKAQSALKAVWSDGRIDTIVSHMPTIDIVQENAAAAMQNQISKTETAMLTAYAAETDHLYCRGCDHLCSPHVQAPVRIGDTLRYVMYHDNYGECEHARAQYRQLPEAARCDYASLDFSAAEAACPHRVPIGQLMRRAQTTLA